MRVSPCQDILSRTQLQDILSRTQPRRRPGANAGRACDDHGDAKLPRKPPEGKNDSLSSRLMHLDSMRPFSSEVDGVRTEADVPLSPAPQWPAPIYRSTCHHAPGLRHIFTAMGLAVYVLSGCVLRAPSPDLLVTTHTSPPSGHRHPPEDTSATRSLIGVGAPADGRISHLSKFS